MTDVTTRPARPLPGAAATEAGQRPDRSDDLGVPVHVGIGRELLVSNRDGVGLGGLPEPHGHDDPAAGSREQQGGPGDRARGGVASSGRGASILCAALMSALEIVGARLSLMARADCSSCGAAHDLAASTLGVAQAIAPSAPWRIEVPAVLASGTACWAATCACCAACWAIGTALGRERPDLPRRIGSLSTQPATIVYLVFPGQDRHKDLPMFFPGWTPSLQRSPQSRRWRQPQAGAA